MSNSCVFIPNIGKDLFKSLRKQYGYNKAVELFYIAINPEFIDRNKESLSLDSEGVPSFDSFMKNPFVKEKLTAGDIISSQQKNFQKKENTIVNYTNSIDEAYAYNRNSPTNNKVIAVVETNEDGTIQVVLKPKNAQTEQQFNSQYSAQVLNRKLSSIFGEIGVTVGNLTQIEIKAGRVGVTDFDVARSLASDFGSIIRVANNMEGAKAISEEFSHLIIGCFIEDPSIKRAIKTLSEREEILQEILGDDYKATVEFHDGDMTKVAEEALGHILQDALMSEISGSNPTIVKRAMKNVINKFKKYNIAELEEAMNEAETVMSNLAKGILDGTKEITKEDIISNRRKLQLNALSASVDKNIDILKTALKTEQKRFAISTVEIKRRSKDLIFEIKTNLSDDAATVYGILSYAKTAVDKLNNLHKDMSNLSTMSLNAKFATLRQVKLYLDSYGPFIQALNDRVAEDLTESTLSKLFEEYEIKGVKINVQDILKELNNMNKLLASAYYKAAKKSFVEMLTPFLGSSITFKTGEHAGETMSVEELLNTANSDITFFDRWLDSMGDSADVILQGFASIVNKAKSDIRVQTIKDIQDIQKLRMEAENMGITDFDYIFERDNEGNLTGNYIDAINYGQHAKDMKEFMEEMDKKYGVNPTGQEAKDKLKEINNWHAVHSIITLGNIEPNPALYENKDYTNLSADEKDILNKILNMKKKFDNLLPDNRVSTLKAIQIRKSNAQRFLDSFNSPSALFNNISEGIAHSLLDREDDDALFGNRRTALTGFDGREFMTLPVLYTNRLQDPNELSTDVFGSLMSYAYMANNYDGMDNVLDGLEVGRSIVENPEQRKVKSTRGNKSVIEKFKVGSDEVTNDVAVRQSNIVAKLNDFFESQIYGRYLKDQGTFDVFGKKVNIQKLVSEILAKSSFVQLGFNFLTNIANITNGIAMQNIEAFCGQYFSVSELAAADAAYLGAMKDFMAEIGDRNKKSKLALFDQLFNIKQDFDINPAIVQKKNWFERLFSARWAFIGQSAGDHWLYNRTAIAMAKRKEVLYKGEKMSLWDALEVRDKFSDNSEIKELNYDEIQELDGSTLDVYKFSRMVAKRNQRLFGIYNTEDANAANSVAIGRLLMQYRKWMKPLFNVRFQKGQKDVETGEWEEGYYRTVARLGRDLLRGKIQLGECWDSMEEFEKRNCIRTLTEIIQWLVVWGLANWLEWPKDKKRPWALKLTEYLTKRLAHETGGLTPSTVMIQENLKTIKDPVASIGMVQDALNLFNSCITPSDWDNTISSGPYKGLSTLEKNIMKSPLPGVAQYHMINKFTGNLDNSILYYARPAY